MPKASPILKAFNAGVFSPLMEGRVDLDRYPVSMRRMTNFIPTAQGPMLRRSGTAMAVPAFDETKHSSLVPFIYSNDAGQVYNLEFAHLRIRFNSEAGLLAYTPVAVTAIAAGTPLVFTAAGHGASIGDQVVVAGADYATNLNGTVGNVTGVAGPVVTTNIPRPAGGVGSLATMTLARVYHVVTPYIEADVSKVRYTGDRDALYLWCDGYAPRKLTRYGAYDWRLTVVDFIDGPYDNVNETTTTLKPSGTGNAIPIMTANNLPAGLASGSSAAAGTDYFHAFDDSPTTYWQSNVNQTGILEYDFAAATIVDGYTIEVARVNNDATYKSIDYAPGSWTFEAYDGANWVVLHSLTNYVVYDNLRSLYFKIKNATAYTNYRISITQCTRNGPISPRIARLVMTARAGAVVNIVASAVTGINNDQGFLATDVGRAIRIQGKDGVWRPLKITAWTDTTHVAAEVTLDVLSGIDATTEWRLGLFSTTTGYPTCGGFYEDRLFMGGMSGYPDWLVGSTTGRYDTIQQTDANGTVNDDNGIVVRLNARRLGRIGWIGSDNRSLLLGTGSGEWAVSSSDLQAALSSKTAKARRTTVRGSASIEPVQVDRQLLFIQRSGRTLREMSYAFDIDGYKTPSMSLFSSHLGINQFQQIDFAFEPLAVAWLRTGDGKLVGFTYNREENVVGWHEHDLAGGYVESISVIPSTDGKQDILWLVVRRVINGTTRRFIERLTPIWDVDSTLDTAFFVDCGVRYAGAAIGTIYGLKHLEGARVVGLADGSPIVPQIVVGGAITLPDSVTATNLVLGLGYDAVAETSRIEAGAGDGTAQGKNKRAHEAVIRLWQSGGGEIGVRTADDAIDDTRLEKIVTTSPETQLDAVQPLFSGDYGPISMPEGYNKSGSITVRQSGDVPLPLNIVAIMPQLNTQDR